MVLAILIPTLPARAGYLATLVANLHAQMDALNANDKVVLLFDDDETKTTGFKRNCLLQRAWAVGAKYVWHIDDDDDISVRAINLVLNATATNPDVIGINGWMTTDGANRVDWEIRLGHPYCAVQRDGKEFYLRWPNHITPMKLEHAIKIKFPDKILGEDYEWSKMLNDSGHLKTQEIIDEPLYHYQCRTKK